MPCVLSKETFEEVKTRYHYMLSPMASGKSTSAQVDFQTFDEDFGSFTLDGMEFKYFSYEQTNMKVNGFRFGNFAYVTDIREFSDRVLKELQGVDTLVLSALRHTPTRMHFSVDEAIAFSRRTLAKTTYLTHIAHDLEHAATNAILPPDVRMGYDGLEMTIEIPDKDMK